jgi:hypothetical protein
MFLCLYILWGCQNCIGNGLFGCSAVIMGRACVGNSMGWEDFLLALP